MVEEGRGRPGGVGLVLNTYNIWGKKRVGIVIFGGGAGRGGLELMGCVGVSLEWAIWGMVRPLNR